jgi:hypothetical protein
VLDQDEFEQAGLEPVTRAQALTGLAAVRELFKSKQPGI